MDRKNYGNNLMVKCFKHQYIIGLKRDIKLIIIMIISYIALFTGWVICLYSFYPFYLLMIGALLFILVLWYYLISFLTEPGIIPRRYHTFMTLCEGSNEQNSCYKKQHQHLEIKTNSNDNSLYGDNSNSNNNTSVNNNNNSLIINNSLFINDDNKKIVVNIFPEITQMKDMHKDEKKENDANSHDIHNNSLIFIPKEEENKSTTPSIFQHKQCPTCEITRPPKASHCKICDNCIMKMDHHCFYISNCVGERNHCFFILFLLFGSVLSWLIFFTSIYHLIYIICIYPDNISLLILKNSYIELIASCILIVISILFFCIKCLSTKYAIVSSVIGYALLLYSFIVNYIKEKTNGNRSFKQYYHPFSSLIIIALTPMACFVNRSLIRQFNTLSRGLTIKQYDSISKEIKSMAIKGLKLDTTAFDPITFTRRFNNIWAFMIHKRSISLLNH